MHALEGQLDRRTINNNNNEKEEEPHGIDPAEAGLRRRNDHPQSHHTFGFSLDSPRL